MGFFSLLPVQRMLPLKGTSYFQIWNTAVYLQGSSTTDLRRSATDLYICIQRKIGAAAALLREGAFPFLQVELQQPNGNIWIYTQIQAEGLLYAAQGSGLASCRLLGPSLASCSLSAHPGNALRLPSPAPSCLLLILLNQCNSSLSPFPQWCREVCAHLCVSLTLRLWRRSALWHFCYTPRTLQGRFLGLQSLLG